MMTLNTNDNNDKMSQQCTMNGIHCGGTLPIGLCSQSPAGMISIQIKTSWTSNANHSDGNVDNHTK